MKRQKAPSDRHTPGPWFRRKEWKSDRRALEIYPKDPTVKPPFKPSAVAVVNWVRDGEAIANARLIAAAPELLEALQDLESRVETASDYLHNSQLWHEEGAPEGSGTVFDWIFRNARKAISKAEGATERPEATLPEHEEVR